jgi:hypothetical protein
MIWLCSIAVLLLCCSNWLLRADLNDAKKQMENFNPYYNRMLTLLGEAENRMRRLRDERNMWRERWKQGSFEMDAATMAKLADADVHWPKRLDGTDMAMGEWNNP